jgi:hypothetical protein
MDQATKEKGKDLILLILKEKHPEPVHSEELKRRFVELVRTHGSFAAAVEFMKRRLRQ